MLQRLRHSDHVAYLVGGSVRDLLLGRRPKDFDIGTSAHPHEVKKLFRNCWIIGRRFRLAHVKFGTKTIEVATFRRLLSEAEVAEHEAAAAESRAGGGDRRGAGAGPPRPRPAAPAFRDNTFGTPEEDAFRRDFTVNALFYDIATFSIIDYTGGIEDSRRGSSARSAIPTCASRRIRCACCARSCWPRASTSSSIRRWSTRSAGTRGLIAKASPARLLEEFYKILRSGASERAFRQLAEVGLLEHLAPGAGARSRPGVVAVRAPPSTPIATLRGRCPNR